jgi:uncharacterized membrane protein YkoI
LLTVQRLVLLLAIGIVALVLPPRALGEDCKRNQDCALGAFQRGEVRPLSEVLAVARARFPGEVVKVELEREDGIWVYEIKILTASGRVRELEINAKTLAIIKVE